MPINLSETPLKCPSCDNTDASKMVVFQMEWLNVQSGSPVYTDDPAVLRTPPEGDDTIECQALVDDDTEPVCHYRGSVNDFALYAAGTQVLPFPSPEVHGEAIPPESAPPADDNKKKKG